MLCQDWKIVFVRSDEDFVLVDDADKEGNENPVKGCFFFFFLKEIEVK